MKMIQRGREEEEEEELADSHERRDSLLLSHELSRAGVSGIFYSQAPSTQAMANYNAQRALSLIQTFLACWS
jgi:hypothetical protein